MAREAFRSLATALLVATFLSTVFSFVPPCPKRPAARPRTWDYTSQVSWGAQYVGWKTCSAGSNQSPIDIFTPVNRNGYTDRSINPRYNGSQSVFLFNTGNYFIGSAASPVHSVSYQGVTYYLKNFLFHSPSEHLLNGVRFDLEMQLVHTTSVSATSKSPRELVISIFFQRATGAITNKFLEQIIYDLPQFSDCSCGNGRFEDHTLYENITRTMGVTEQCDNDGRNSGASLPNGQPNCCRPNCVKARCGDGIVDYGESCDNGALNANKTGALCRVNCCNATCGDGILDPSLGEECDDGNRHNLDGCSSICKKECGDGELNIRNGLEQCDNGTANSDTAPNACRTNCKLPTCGDNAKDSNEGCDTLPHGVNPSQCRASCIAPKCGDGFTDFNEDCDDGSLNGPNYACSVNCTTNCGDGIIQTGEECDNGPANSQRSDAACRTNCFLRRCGDGIVDVTAGEQCDAGYLNTNGFGMIGGWWCDGTCQQQCGSGLTPPPVGPATQNPNKKCDHGCYNADLPNRCRTNCDRPVCGDGIVDSGEGCDNGKNNSNSVKNACRLNCKLAFCGDGVVDAGETCDDQNHVAGDGCDPTCRLECGNGNLEASAGEECDYGAANANAADKCRTNCKLPACGDGIVDSLEECDIGARNNDTTPNACRTDCSLPYCGDGVIDVAYGEKCDNGAANSDTAPFGCSLFCIPNYCRQRPTTVALADALPVNRTSFAYLGSSSRPPCQENVQWLVYNEVQMMSEFQYNAFTNDKYGLPNRARNVQGLNGRTITRPAHAPVPVCGNGIQEAGEQCDLGYLMNSHTEANRCRINCMNPTCGDGITDRGEECDDATWNGVIHRRCTNDCKLKPKLVNPFVPLQWSCANSCKWSMLSSLHASCAGDRPEARQSPVNIETSAVKGLNPKFALPTFAYGNSEIRFVNTGRSLSLLPTGTHTFAGAKLDRIEFHAPSEHTINGLHADLEAQLLHSTPDGNMVGVALLYNVGSGPSSFLSQFEFYVPRFAGCALNNGIIDDGEECDDGPLNSDSRPGSCRRNGKKPTCGDGIVDRGEHCDDGPLNNDAPNSCKMNCALPFCGDGFLDAGEQCDFNDKNGKPCDSWCNLLCGNGLLDGDEVCDDGPRNSDSLPGACRTNCKKASCGDGIIDDGEACDDGPINGLTSSGCRAGCLLAKCGDSVIDYAFGELCDNGAANGPDAACDSKCQPACGNGKVQPALGEQCDLGAMNSNAAGSLCRYDCTKPTCGDAITDLGEECDNGLVNGNSSCSVNCTLRCGNSVVDPGEECDWGTNNDDTLPNTCRTTCKKWGCGDGVQDAGEQCDFGTQNADQAGAPCRVLCKLPSMGDNVVDKEEECDDGNTNNNDGCSATGKWECGNGRRDGDKEQCDDGALNSLAPNSCRPRGARISIIDISCRLPFCGDGIVDAGEECDDGVYNGAGSNYCRALCKLPVCGDGIVDDLFGEVCDMGEDNNDMDIKDGACSTTCQPNKCRSSSAPAGRLFGFTNAFWDSPVATYQGSLTSPPCTEKVTWYVLTKPATITAKQLAMFSTGGCSRGVQPLNGRPVAHTDAAGSICGNCKVEPGEECDTGDNNEDAPNKCKKSCRKPRCGDGWIDAGEECDNGLANSPDSTCDLRCKWVRSCPAVCTGGRCPSCAAPPAANAPLCGNQVTNNSGTIINVNFARLLSGAGCTGPNCSQ